MLFARAQTDHPFTLTQPVKIALQTVGTLWLKDTDFMLLGKKDAKPSSEQEGFLLDTNTRNLRKTSEILVST